MDMKSKLLYVRTSRDCRSVSSRLVVVLFKSLASYSKGWGSLVYGNHHFSLLLFNAFLGEASGSREGRMRVPEPQTPKCLGCRRQILNPKP